MRISEICILSLLLGMTASATAELRQNIEYARPNGVALALDAFVPAGDGPFPAVLVVHGGGFTGGDRRRAVAPLREALSDGNFVWFSIDYRLAPTHKPSDASDDVDAAVGFIRQHAREFKVDSARIALLGESAGGYLVLMAASRLGGDEIKAVAAVGGPAQLWTLAPEIVAHVERVFGIKGEAALKAVSPISHLRTSMPPVLLLHGSGDSHVPLAQAEALCQAMKAKQQSCELHAIPGGGHSANDWAAMPASGGFPPVLRNWLARRLALATASTTPETLNPYTEEPVATKPQSAGLKDVIIEPDAAVALVEAPLTAATLIANIRQMPWTGAGAAALEAYRQARELKIEDTGTRIKLALMLYDGRHYEQALEAFKNLEQGDVRFLALVWQGHLLDLLGRRSEAISRYEEALKTPGPPIIWHDQYGLGINKAWVQDRLKTPFDRDPESWRGRPVLHGQGGVQLNEADSADRLRSGPPVIERSLTSKS